MGQEQINGEIFSRLAKLEKMVFSDVAKDGSPAAFAATAGKPKTLREIVKGKKFKNGQERVAAVVGYHEKILEISSGISEDEIKKGWIEGKLDGKYDHNFLSRADGDLVREVSAGKFDLTGTGEKFFENLLLPSSAQ